MITINNVDYYDTKEVAALLKVSSLTVNKYVRSGRLIPFKLNPKKLLYSAQNIENFIQGKNPPENKVN